MSSPSEAVFVTHPDFDAVLETRCDGVTVSAAHRVFPGGRQCFRLTFADGSVRTFNCADGHEYGGLKS